MEELTVVRVWADRVLQDAQGASSVLTDEILNCSIRLLHKGGDTSDQPSDWRPIGLLNVGMQLVHHIINYRLTIITEAENLIVPGQDGGRAGRGVDLNQLKLDWVTSEAKRLKQRIIRIDIDFKNAFNSMSQTALWAVMRAYNIPDVDLLEVIYGRTTACMDSDDAECAIITFLTGVIQGGASSPRIFIIFINALLEHLTSTGKALGISHGMVGTEQFNNIAFMDDITTLAQDNTGSQILLDAIQELEDWSNTRLNLGKTVVMDVDGGSGQQDPPTLKYKGRPVKTFQAEDSCRHLGFWATPNGDMAKTKQRVLAKTREVLGLLTHHPLESKIAKELFHSMAVSVFRFSAAQVRWSKAELDQLRSLWVQAYKRADHLPKGTASDIFIFPEKRGGEELSTPINIIAQELCNNIRRSLVHDDVAKSITVMELQRAKDEWMCHTLHELYDEMELWEWDAVQHNRWARALKASNQVKVRPMWYIEDTEQEGRKLSWATVTRSLRRLKARIVKVGGKREQPKEQTWTLADAAQWELLFRGEEVFWKTAGAIRDAGYGSVLSLIQETATAQSPVPLLTREEGPGSRGTRHLRILIPMGIKGIMECERATLQAWLELVDWTGLEVLPGSQVPRKMKLNMDSKGAMHQWLALAEMRCGITDHDDAQMFTNNGRELSALAKAIREQTPNAEDRVQSMSGGEVLCTALIAWLRDGDDSLEVSQKVVEMVWPRACAEWPQTQQSWKSEGATKLELLSEIETELRKGGARCQQYLTRLGYYCPRCQHGSCTVCNDKEGRIQCPRCQTPFPHMTPVHRQQVRTHAYAPPCLNLHALGDQWIGEVSDVDIVQNPQEDSHEGDQLIFKAHIRGWETEVRQIRCQSLKGKSDLALRQALLRPGWKDILLIPQHWYPADSPKFETEGWWYAPAEEVLGRTCKSCRTFYEIENSAGAKRSRRSNVRCPKCQSENDQAKATGERGKQKNTQRKKAARALDTSNLRRSERMRGQERVCYHGSSSESDSLDSDDDHEYDARPCYGIRMRAADPRYITEGNDINRGDVLLTMAQVKQLIDLKAKSAAEIATIWLTTAEMGFSLTAESNEVTCPQDAREGKVSDRFLAPAISSFATSVLADDEQVEDLTQPVNEARRQLESLHRRWSKITKTSESENVRMKACKEAEKSNKFIRIVQRRDLPWEKDSIARAAYDPEHIPDCNVQATVGKHFLFHEEIPKAANGLGYLRVTTKSLWWQHEHFPNVWTSEGLTTCMENGYPWTINSTTWNHLRMMWLAAGDTESEEINGREEVVGQEGAAEREHVEERGGTTEQEGKAGSNAATGRGGATGREAADEGVKAAKRKGTTGREGATERGALDLLRHVYLESLFQDALEANGYRSPTWRILRALQAIIKANVVIGESRLTAAPFFEGAGRPSGPFWGPQQGRRVILWESLSREDQQKCLNDLQDDTDWVIWCKA
jgi:hypothetical protein